MFINLKQYSVQEGMVVKNMQCIKSLYNMFCDGVLGSL